MNEQSGPSKTKGSADDIFVSPRSENILIVTNPERETSFTNYRTSKFFDAVFEEHINNIDKDDQIININNDRNSSQITLKSIFPVRSRDPKVEEIYSYRSRKIKVQNPSKTSSQSSPILEPEQNMNMAARRFSESYSNASKISDREHFRRNNSKNHSRDTLILKSQQMKVNQMPDIPERPINRYSRDTDVLLMRSEMEIPNPGAESDSDAIWCKCINDKGTIKCPKYERSRQASFEAEKNRKSICVKSYSSNIKPNNSKSTKSNYSNSMKSYSLSIEPDNSNSMRSKYSNSIKSYNSNSIKPDNANSINSKYSNNIMSYKSNVIEPDNSNSIMPNNSKSTKSNYSNSMKSYSLSIEPDNSNTMRSKYSNNIKSYNSNSIKPDNANSINSKYSNNIMSYKSNAIEPDNSNSIMPNNSKSTKSNYSNSMNSYNLSIEPNNSNSMKSKYSNNIKSYNANSIEPDDANSLNSIYSSNIMSYNSGIGPDNFNNIQSNKSTNTNQLETIRLLVDEALLELLHLYPYYCTDRNCTDRTMKSNCSISIHRETFGPGLGDGFLAGLQILTNWYYGKCGDSANVQEIKEDDISMIDSDFIEEWLAREYAKLYQEMEKAKEDPQSTGPLSEDCLKARENTLNLIAELLDKKRLLERGIIDTPSIQEWDSDEEICNKPASEIYEPIMVDECTSPISSLCDISETEPIYCVNASTFCNIIPECYSMGTSPVQSQTCIQTPREVCQCLRGSTSCASKSLEESSIKPNCYNTCTHGKEILIQCIPKNPNITSTPYKEILIEKKSSILSSHSAKSKRSLSFKCTSPVDSIYSSNSYNKNRNSAQLKTFDDYLAVGRKIEPSYDERMSNVANSDRLCACTKPQVTGCHYASSKANDSLSINSKILNGSSLKNEFVSPGNSFRSAGGQSIKMSSCVQCGSPVSRNNAPLINSCCKCGSPISSRNNTPSLNYSCYKGESPTSSRNHIPSLNSCKGESPTSSRNCTPSFTSYRYKGESPTSSRNCIPPLNSSCYKGASPSSSRNYTPSLNSSCRKGESPTSLRNNTPSLNRSCCKGESPTSPRNNTPSIHSACYKGESPTSSRNYLPSLNSSCCKGESPMSLRNNTQLINSSCCKCGSPISSRNNTSLINSAYCKCGSPISSRNDPSPLRLSFTSSTANQNKCECSEYNSGIEATELSACQVMTADDKDTISIGIQNSVVVKDMDPIEMINQTTSYCCELIDDNENIPIDSTEQKTEEPTPQSDSPPCECKLPDPCKSCVAILINDCRESSPTIDSCRCSRNIFTPTEPCRRKIPRLQIRPTGGLFTPWNTCDQAICPTAFYQQRSINQCKKSRLICDCKHKMINLKGKCSNKRHDIICDVPTLMRNEKCCSPCSITEKINKHSVRIVNVRPCKSEPNICNSKCAVRNVIYGVARIVKYDNFTIFEVIKSTKHVSRRVPKKSEEIFVIRTKR